MMAILCNVNLWFLNLYQSLKEIFDSKTGHNIFDCNQEVIFDKSGDFSAPCSDLYSMYKIWYERNHPEDKLVSSRKFGLIMVSILSQSVVTWSGNASVRSYKSNIQTIETKLRACYGCDPSTIVF